MMRRVLFPYFLVAVLLTPITRAAEVPCWMSGEKKDGYDPITSELAILKTLLLPINLNNPKGDLEKRLLHGDYRLIGVGGVGITYPSVELSKNGQLLCKLGSRYIEGTGDVYINEEHSVLESKFFEYAKKYNSELIRWYEINKDVISEQVRVERQK